MCVCLWLRVGESMRACSRACEARNECSHADHWFPSPLLDQSLVQERPLHGNTDPLPRKYRGRRKNLQRSTNCVGDKSAPDWSLSF